jgi:urease accessory protein
MIVVRAPMDVPGTGAPTSLLIDRLTLAKRRWRATASDGREFGFDLEEPLHDGAPFHQESGALYLIAQQPEPVLEIALSSPSKSARLGWLIGNLHFSLQLDGDLIRVPDDPALRQLFAREHIHFTEASHVFHPERGGHSHHVH